MMTSTMVYPHWQAKGEGDFTTETPSQWPPQINALARLSAFISPADLYEQLAFYEKTLMIVNA